jgi:hypothetical protein
MRWLCLLLLLWPALAQARTYVLAVGNNLGRADEVELRFARQDAQRFAGVLQRLGGVRAVDVVALNGATAEGFQQALAAISRRMQAEARPAEAALVVYYSGHADAVGLHLGDTTLPYQALRAQVTAAPAAVRVLVLDGCRSGGLTRVKGARAAAPFTLALDHKLAVEGLAVMTSSAAGEDSHESDRLGGAFFTHHLISALVGAGDHDGDGQVTLTEAYGYAYHHTLRASGRTATLQHPTYSYDLKGRGDFVMTRPRAATGSAQLKLGAPVRHLIRAGGASGPLHAEVVPERAGATISLPPGPYFVQARHRDHYLEYALRLARGTAQDLRGTPNQRVAYARLVRKGGATRASHGVLLLAGTRAPVLAGRGPELEATLGYTLALPWASLGLRGRHQQGQDTVGGRTIQQRSLGLGLTLERVLDLGSSLSVGVGLITEGIHETQQLPTETRTGWALVFGALLSAEVPLWGPLNLRLEGGPVTHVFPLATVQNGVQTGTTRTSRISAQGALGLGVRF